MDDFRPLDPVGPQFPQQRGIGGQFFPNVSPINIEPELGDEGPYQPPEPLPYPPGIPREAVDNIALIGQKVAQSLLGNRFSREKIAAFLEESQRVFFRPVFLPPWHEMPIAGTPMQAVASATVNAGATGTIITLTVPRGSHGFVAWFGQDTQNDAAGVGGTDWASLEWTIALVTPDGNTIVPVLGYNALTFQIGQIEAPTRVNIFVPGGFSLVVRVANTSVGNIPGIAALLRGWHWPVAVRMSSVNVNEHIRG